MDKVDHPIELYLSIIDHRPIFLFSPLKQKAEKTICNLIVLRSTIRHFGVDKRYWESDDWKKLKRPGFEA
jgi:hypothetical protein